MNNNKARADAQRAQRIVAWEERQQKRQDIVNKLARDVANLSASLEDFYIVDEELHKQWAKLHAKKDEFQRQNKTIEQLLTERRALYSETEKLKEKTAALEGRAALAGNAEELQRDLANAKAYIRQLKEANDSLEIAVHSLKGRLANQENLYQERYRDAHWGKTVYVQVPTPPGESFNETVILRRSNEALIKEITALRLQVEHMEQQMNIVHIPDAVKQTNGYAGA